MSISLFLSVECHKTAKKVTIRPISPYFTTLSEVGLHHHKMLIYETCVDKDGWLSVQLCANMCFQGSKVRLNFPSQNVA